MLEEKIRILFLGDTQHPNSQNWISGLEKYGNFSVTSWSLPWPSGITGKIKRVGTFFLAPVIVRKLIKKEKPAIVIGYRLTSYGFIAALSGHKKIVLAAQANSDIYSPLNITIVSTWLKKLLATYAIKKATIIHAWSEIMAANIYALGAPPGKVLVMHRGIDFELFTVPKQKSIHNLNIIVTRALFPEYKHDVIIHAVKKAIDKGIPVELKIIGTGAEESSLRKLTANLNIETHVKFYGRINNEDLVAELKESNVYVSMPITEGVSASLIEAMACFCIPVVSDIPPNRLWIDDKGNGYLIPLDDVETLANTFLDIWNRKDSFGKILEENRKLVERKCSQRTNLSEFRKQYLHLINTN